MTFDEEKEQILKLMEEKKVAKVSGREADLVAFTS